MAEVLVLIVEDSETLRRLTTRQLSTLGLKTDTAGDGQQAIEKYTRGQYDMILMDVMMPNVSGLEATKEIRKLEESNGAPRVPIIAMTAYGERAECLEAGMDDYLFKPVRLSDLRMTMSKWLPATKLPKSQEQVLNKANAELSKTKRKLDSVRDKIIDIRRKYGLD